jgi:catechol 2,3-dioxygenase
MREFRLLCRRHCQNVRYLPFAFPDFPQMPLRLDATLDHLQLGSQDPRRLAEFHREVMGAEIAEIAPDLWRCEGPERRLLVGPGAARSLGFAGYRAASQAVLDQLAERLKSAGVARLDPISPWFKPGAVAFADPDGNRLEFGLSRARAGAGEGLPARLQHLVLASTDAARMGRFYEAVLGFAPSDRVLDEAGDLRTVFLRSDHEHHSIGIFQAPENRLDHHCYEAGDWGLIRDWADHFAARRIPLSWGPGRHGPGNNLFIFINDCDGNWVEISAEIERVDPDREAGTWPHEERTLNSWGRAPLRS